MKVKQLLVGEAYGLPSGVTLGSKAHHQLMARAKTIDAGNLLAKIARSTIPHQSYEDIKDVISSVGKNTLNRNDLEQIATITNVELEELLHVAGF